MSKAILDTAEVIHDYMRNGDRSTSREECITWIARLIQEVSQQAPSATDKLSDIQKEAVTEFTKWKEGLSVYKAPSATVDEIANEIRGMKFAFDEREKKDRIEQIARSVEALHSQQPTVDEITFLATLNGKTETFTFSDITVSGIMNNEIWAKGILLSAQGLNNPDVKISVIQHSQQPTVDVENVAKEIADDVQQTLDGCSNLYRNTIQKRIQQALRGSYSKIGDNK